MIDQQAILARLRAGETIDTIAEELTNALNLAEKEYQETEAAQAEAALQEKAKREAVLMILDGVCDYLFVSGEHQMLEQIRNIDVDKVIRMLDGSLLMSKRMEELKEVAFADLGNFFN